MAKLTLPAEEQMEAGHFACQGCGAALTMRHVLKGFGPEAVLVIPACCWAVIPGPMPNTCLKVSTVFCAFEATASVATGIKAGLRRTGRGNVPVVAFAGDGGTADIGLQALSGAAERNEDILYVCYDNEAYMNTGIQRSGLTPPGALTTTTPHGLAKLTPKKDLPGILAAHGIPYVATANPSYPEDLVAKVKRSLEFRGTRYLHILADCPTGWKHDPSKMVEVGRLATMSNVWPLYEVVNGSWRITWAPAAPVPVARYLRSQGRFKDLAEPDVAAIQELVDRNWAALKAKVAASAPTSPPPERKAMPPPSAPLPSPPEPPTGPMPLPIPAATMTLECYLGGKICDGSCGKLLPGGLCSEISQLSARVRA